MPVFGEGRSALPVSDVVVPAGAYNSAFPTPSTQGYSALGATALFVYINLTAFTGTSVTFRIEAWDEGSQAWYALFTGPAMTTTGVQVLVIDPREVAGTTVKQFPLPHRWRVNATYSAVTAASFSVSGTLTP